METDFLKLVAAGGDLAMYAVAALLWRMNARLVRVETKLEGKD